MPLIQFETCAIENKKKSARLGKACYEDGVMAIITIDRKSNLKIPFAALRKGETEAAFKARLPQILSQDMRDGEGHITSYFPAVWAYVKGRTVCDGTPLSQMVWLSPGQVETLRSAGINSVESLAKIGNGIIEPFGLDGVDLSRKARAWLDEQSGKAVATMQQQAAELDALHAQNADMRAAMEQLQEQLAALQAEKKRGRPKA